MRRVSVTEARSTLPELLNDVVAGHDILLTRHGTVVAIVVSPESWRARRPAASHQLAAEIDAQLSSSGRTRPSGSISAQRADALVTAVRTARA